MSGIRTRSEAFIDWTWTYFAQSRGPQVLDRSDAARINWQDDAEERPEPTAHAVPLPEAEAQVIGHSTAAPGPVAEPKPAPAAYPTLTLLEVLSRDYDVIIIGTGAGGGTLAHQLAPSGKRILLLERGDFLPRERENWDADEAVFASNRYVSHDTWHDATGAPFQPGVHYFVGGATKMSGAPSSGGAKKTSRSCVTTTASPPPGRSPTKSSSPITRERRSSTASMAYAAPTRPNPRPARPTPSRRWRTSPASRNSAIG
jgi:hypothetical protein